MVEENSEEATRFKVHPERMRRMDPSGVSGQALNLEL